MFVSGAREKPKYPVQRRRARMMLKNRVILATSSGRRLRPTKARSKWFPRQAVILLEE